MFTLKLKTTYQLHTFLNNQVGIFSTIFLLTCETTGNDPPQHVYTVINVLLQTLLELLLKIKTSRCWKNVNKINETK